MEELSFCAGMVTKDSGEHIGREHHHAHGRGVEQHRSRSVCSKDGVNELGVLMRSGSMRVSDLVSLIVPLGWIAGVSVASWVVEPCHELPGVVPPENTIVGSVLVWSTRHVGSAVMQRRRAGFASARAVYGSTWLFSPPKPRSPYNIVKHLSLVAYFIHALWHQDHDYADLHLSGKCATSGGLEFWCMVLELMDIHDAQCLAIFRQCLEVLYITVRHPGNVPCRPLHFELGVGTLPNMRQDLSTAHSLGCLPNPGS